MSEVGLAETIAHGIRRRIGADGRQAAGFMSVLLLQDLVFYFLVCFFCSDLFL